MAVAGLRELVHQGVTRDRGDRHTAYTVYVQKSYNRDLGKLFRAKHGTMDVYWELGLRIKQAVLDGEDC